MITATKLFVTIENVKKKEGRKVQIRYLYLLLGDQHPLNANKHLIFFNTKNPLQQVISVLKGKQSVNYNTLLA